MTAPQGEGDLHHLAQKALLWEFLGVLLYRPPLLHRIENWASEDVFFGAPLAGDAPGLKHGLSLLRAWKTERWEPDPAGAFGDLQCDYFQLFIGPGAVPAAPWESVWRTQERLLFQTGTLSVRAWYRRYGLQSRDVRREPDDHIGLELAFAAHLSKRAMEMAEDKRAEQMETILRDRDSFLSQHVTTWAAQWCEAVHAHARTPFYRGVASLVQGTLSA